MKNRKEVKMKESKFVICILIISFSCFILQGCKYEKSLESNPEGETAISSEADSLNDIMDMTNNKDEKQFEWLDEKISVHTPDEWSKSIDENKQFIFILTKENKILKVDKENKRSTVIINNENKREEEIFFLKATEENLYYQVSDTEIYQYNLVNEKITKIFESERDVDSIFGIQIYNNNMYLYMSGLVICEFDLKTKEKKELIENVGNAVFYDNKLFFIKKGGDKYIYCLNLGKNKIEIARELKNKMEYVNLFVYGNRLCYVLDGKKCQIYAYSLKGQDKLLISLKANQVWNPYNRSPYVYSYDKDTLYYVYEEDDNSYLCAYTGKKGAADIKLQLPEDYAGNGYICSGYFFYETYIEDEDQEGALEYKYIFIE